MDLSLAKAGPVSNFDRTSVVTYLRKGKNCCASAAGKEECVYVRETTVQTSRSVKKEVEESSTQWRRDSPAAHGGDNLQPVEDTMPEQVHVP